MGRTELWNHNKDWILHPSTDRWKIHTCFLQGSTVCARELAYVVKLNRTGSQPIRWHHLTDWCDSQKMALCVKSETLPGQDWTRGSLHPTQRFLYLCSSLECQISWCTKFWLYPFHKKCEKYVFNKFYSPLTIFLIFQFWFPLLLLLL